MADKADDVNGPEITLEDFDADEKQETAKAEPSPAKQEEPAKAEGTKEEKTDDTAAPPAVPTKDEGTEPSKEEPVAEGTEDKPKGADERKANLNTEIRDLVSQRNNLRGEVEKLTGEAYQVATEKDLVDQTNPATGESFTAIEAKVEAMRQEQAMSKYNTEVVDRQLQLGQESYQVMQDFPIFNPDSDTFDKELATEAADLLDANLIRDDNVPEIGADGKPTGKGMITGATVSPYKLYQTLARASGISSAKGQMKGQADTEKQLANVDAPTSAAPPVKAKDPLTALWDEPL